MAKKKILFLSIQNASRSQMAEALLRDMAGDHFEVWSAGDEPAEVSPEAIAVLREMGIDIRQQRSKSVDELDGQEFDFAIAVCDSMNEGCPVVAGASRYLHWSFQDPAAVKGSDEERMRAFRKVRDGIQGRLKGFINEQVGFRRAAHV